MTTKFRERLETLGPNPVQMDPDYKRAIWCLLIGVGAALRPEGLLPRTTKDGKYVLDDNGSIMPQPWSYDDYEELRDFYSYYGGRLYMDKNKTSEAYHIMRNYGVDFANSSDPCQRTFQEFNGTFAEDESESYHIGGKLVLGNGEVFWWGVTCEEGTFGKILKSIILEFTLDEALDELEDRLTIPPSSSEYYIRGLAEYGRPFRID